MQAINARGVFLCYKYAAQEMIKQGRGGRIIGASSIAGKQGFEGMSAYSASKFAVRGLTQAAAKDLARHGITVNAYAPGYVDTAMTRNLFKDDPEALLRDITKIPVARLAEGDDIAALVSFLASKDAEYITGQSMSINGGLYFD
ncbi:hypothetical protein ONZ45_g12160 [Pleurotus djamor]|nr:hypothetical protein ONZ45_g12160 [Pleurotus djamor]